MSFFDNSTASFDNWKYLPSATICTLFLFITEQSIGFNLDFEVSGIYGYVMLDGVLPSLHALTCTFWMKSSDDMNYGTPISYAVDNGSDNTLLLTDYNG